MAEENKREEPEHPHDSPWEHLIHYAHLSHLSAEMGEVVAHASHQMSHIAAAQKIVRTHAQMAYDLARMHRNIFKLKRVFNLGGSAGETAGWRLIRARGLYESAKLAFENERPAVAAARAVLSHSKSVPAGLRGGVTAQIGTAAFKLEQVLGGSRIGSKLLATGRIMTSKAFTHGLIAVGAAASAVEAYNTSPAETTRGKVNNAILGGGAGALTMANPWVAAADVLAPKGFKPGELFRGTADALTSIDEAFSPDGSDAMLNFHRRSKEGEYGKVMQEASGFGDFYAEVPHAILSNDTKPLDEIHKRSMNGAYGKVLQAASEAGEFWADKGLKGGLKEFSDSVRWWVSH
jgi:hypothetical protein